MSASVSGRRQRLRWAIRALQVALAGTVAVGVWLIGFAPDGATPEVLPDTTEQFSLDLEVVASTEAPVVYIVEQRARPAYRIFAFDSSTGDDETIFTVPEDAIICGIDLDATGTTLAVTYSPDHTLDGSGLWTLDIADGTFTEISPVETGIYLTDPEWTDDGTAVLATRVNRTTENESLEAVTGPGRPHPASSVERCVRESRR